MHIRKTNKRCGPVPGQLDKLRKKIESLRNELENLVKGEDPVDTVTNNEDHNIIEFECSTNHNTDSENANGHLIRMNDMPPESTICSRIVDTSLQPQRILAWIDYFLSKERYQKNRHLLEQFAVSVLPAVPVVDANELCNTFDHLHSARDSNCTAGWYLCYISAIAIGAALVQDFMYANSAATVARAVAGAVSDVADVDSCAGLCLFSFYCIHWQPSKSVAIYLNICLEMIRWLRFSLKGQHTTEPFFSEFKMSVFTPPDCRLHNSVKVDLKSFSASSHFYPSQKACSASERQILLEAQISKSFRCDVIVNMCQRLLLASDTLSWKISNDSSITPVPSISRSFNSLPDGATSMSLPEPDAKFQTYSSVLSTHFRFADSLSQFAPEIVTCNRVKSSNNATVHSSKNTAADYGHQINGVAHEYIDVPKATTFNSNASMFDNQALHQNDFTSVLVPGGPKLLSLHDLSNHFFHNNDGYVTPVQRVAYPFLNVGEKNSVASAALYDQSSNNFPSYRPLSDGNFDFQGSPVRSCWQPDRIIVGNMLTHMSAQNPYGFYLSNLPHPVNMLYQQSPKVYHALPVSTIPQTSRNEVLDLSPSTSAFSSSWKLQTPCYYQQNLSKVTATSSAASSSLSMDHSMHVSDALSLLAQVAIPPYLPAALSTTKAIVHDHPPQSSSAITESINGDI